MMPPDSGHIAETKEGACRETVSEMTTDVMLVAMLHDVIR